MTAATTAIGRHLVYDDSPFRWCKNTIKKKKKNTPSPYLLVHNMCRKEATWGTSIFDYSNKAVRWGKTRFPTWISLLHNKKLAPKVPFFFFLKPPSYKEAPLDKSLRWFSDWNAGKGELLCYSKQTNLLAEETKQGGLLAVNLITLHAGSLACEPVGGCGR